MKQYGLQLRIAPSKQKKPEFPKPPLRPPAIAFGDDDEDDVEREISLQASKNKALKRIEEQHKKAMEEDPSVFDYDGVYDKMKEEVARPRVQNRTERKSKYLETLVEKSKARAREQEIIYERKLTKERIKDDHLFTDKEKFVTRAYKEKLAEQAKWSEEEKLRQIQEEKEDVTKKSDLSDFYFGLNKNVAFGARSEESKKGIKEDQINASTQEIEGSQLKMEAPPQSVEDTAEADNQPEVPGGSENHTVMTSEIPVVVATPVHENLKAEQASVSQRLSADYKRSEDAVAAARERFLARKRSRVQ